jgi:hypothetical protein
VLLSLVSLKALSVLIGRSSERNIMNASSNL